MSTRTLVTPGKPVAEEQPAGERADTPAPAPVTAGGSMADELEKMFRSWPWGSHGGTKPLDRR